MPATSPDLLAQLLVPVVFWLAIGIVFGLINRNMAKETGRNPIVMLCLGFFLGVVGYLIAREICGLNKHASFRLTTKESIKKNLTSRDLY